MTLAAAKACLAPLQLAMANFAEVPVRSSLKNVFSQTADIQLCHPFGRLCGPEALYETAYAPLGATGWGVMALNRFVADAYETKEV